MEELKKRKEEQYKSKQEQVGKGDSLERGGTLSIGNKVRERGIRGGTG